MAQLDDELAAAYGWQDLWEWRKQAHVGRPYDFETKSTAMLSATQEQFTAAVAEWERELDAEILTRLVALNAARAAEEAAGKIRWLRPAYQAPAGATTQGALAITPKGAKAAKKKATKTPWPKTLADRVKATEQALREARAAVTPAELAKRFLRAKPADLAEILDTLVAMSRAHQAGEKFSV